MNLHGASYLLSALIVFFALVAAASWSLFR